MKEFLQIICLLVVIVNGMSFNHTIICPKAFRLGAEERVILNLHGYQRATVNAKLQDLSEGGMFFSETRNLVVNQRTASRPISLKMMVKDTDLLKVQKTRRVALVINVFNSSGGDFEKRLEVLVSKRSGYIFVITDRPIYKPNDRVYVKVYRMDQVIKRHFEPVEITIKNPGGIGVFRSLKGLPQGIDFAEITYDIEAYSDLGRWTVQVTYIENDYETTTETTFDVLRYTLPTFQVSVDIPRNYINAYSPQVEGTIKAMYSYGKGVDGDLKVSMKLRTSPHSPTAIEFYRIPQPFQHVAFIVNGSYRFAITRRDILLHIQRFNFSEADLRGAQDSGGSVTIEASVSEKSSGRTETVVSNPFPIFGAPYVIDTTRTSAYFTPGLSYRLKAVVKFAVEQNPANQVPYEIIVNNVEVDSGRTNSLGHIDYEHTNIDNATEQNVIIRVTGLNGTEANLTLQAYDSPSRNYLQLFADNKLWKVGENLELTFNFNKDNVSDIRYLVVARGTIVYSGVNHPQAGDYESTEFFRISHKMMPSARVVAYYFVGTEVVANSLWIDVKNICKVQLDIISNQEMIESDGETPVAISLKGPLNAIVSVSAIDQASYFLYNRSRLTSDVMFKKMEEYQQGCDKNGGRNGADVFWEAGLTLSSDEYHQQEAFDLNCHHVVPLRRKRRAVFDDLSNFENGEAGELLDCVDNELIGLIPGENCATNVARCLRANGGNVACCEELQSRCPDAELNRETNILPDRLTQGRRILQREVRSSADITSRIDDFRARIDFSENMIFMDSKLKQNGFLDIYVVPPQSVTTFEISAVSILHNYKEDSFCIAKPKTMLRFKGVFLQVYVPYSLKKLKQENLVVSAFNYGGSSIDVTLQVRPTDTFCTRFPSGEWSDLSKVTINSQQSASSIFTVLPLKLPNNTNGLASVDFRVSNASGFVFDKVRKEILIEEKDAVDSYHAVAIDLSSSRAQTFSFEFSIPERFIPGTLQCWIYAYSFTSQPDFQIEPIDNQLQVQRVESIFRNPTSNGEANLILSGPNAFAHMYLDATGNFSIGPAVNQSLRRLIDGYTRQLRYRSDHDQRGFAIFTNNLPSTWLNAFAVKVFTKAGMYVSDLDYAPLCSSLEWLLTQQEESGEFVERGRHIHREMRGAVGTNLTLTTFVVITMLETRRSCDPRLNQRITDAVSRAMNYLIRSENSSVLTRPYPLSLFAYALTLQQPTSPVAERAIERLISNRISQNGSIHWEEVLPFPPNVPDIHNYWYERQPEVLHIETTAYGLLALIERSKISPSFAIVEIARKVAQWLIEQGNSGIGLNVSTQTVVVGLQALATFESWISESELQNSTNFTIELTATGTVWENPSKPQLHLQEDDYNFIRNKIPIPMDVINRGTVNVTAIGYGEGILQNKCVYRRVNSPACPYIINENIEALHSDTAGVTDFRIRITISVAATNADNNAAVLEVGMLPGFFPIEASARRLIIGEAVDNQIVESYQITDISVIFHLRRVTRERLTLAFDAVQIIVGDRLQPATIKIYDAYSDSINCERFYSLPSQRAHILTSNCASPENPRCRCADGNCLKCRSRAEQLNNTVCLSGSSEGACDLCPVSEDECLNMFAKACRSNYVYEVQVNAVFPPSESELFSSFHATILRVLKSGDAASVEQQRMSNITVEVRQDCLRQCQDDILPTRENEISNVVNEGKVLLIMGGAPDIFIDRNGNQGYTFHLDDGAMIERVIPRRVCTRYERLDCDNLYETLNDEDRQICDRSRLLSVACRNYRSLQERLAEGCD